MIELEFEDYKKFLKEAINKAETMDDLFVILDLNKNLIFESNISKINENEDDNNNE